MLRGKRSYSEFLEAEKKFASNILIDRLTHQQAEGIIEKSRDPENRRSFIYTLTSNGRDLSPILLEIIIGSGQHDQRPNATKTVLHDLEKATKDSRPDCTQNSS